MRRIGTCLETPTSTRITAARKLYRLKDTESFDQTVPLPTSEIFTFVGAAVTIAGSRIAKGEGVARSGPTAEAAGGRVGGGPSAPEAELSSEI